MQLGRCRRKERGISHFVSAKKDRGKKEEREKQQRLSSKEKKGGKSRERNLFLAALDHLLGGTMGRGLKMTQKQRIKEGIDWGGKKKLWERLIPHDGNRLHDG